MNSAPLRLVDRFDCACDHPPFGLVHSHMSLSSKLRAVWKFSVVGGGGALARRPA